MGLGKVTKRLRGLRMLLFPAFAATESRLRASTDEPASSLGEAKRHGLAPPPKHCFRHQGVPRTIFQRHLGLESSSCGAGHLGCREAEIGDLRRTERQPVLQHGVWHTHERTSRIESEFTFLEDHLSTPTLAQ